MAPVAASSSMCASSMSSRVSGPRRPSSSRLASNSAWLAMIRRWLASASRTDSVCSAISSSLIWVLADGGLGQGGEIHATPMVEVVLEEDRNIDTVDAIPPMPHLGWPAREAAARGKQPTRDTQYPQQKACGDLGVFLPTRSPTQCNRP